MNAAFRQIGNAVPPLLALAVARTLREQLVRGAAALGSDVSCHAREGQRETATSRMATYS